MFRGAMGLAVLTLASLLIGLFTSACIGDPLVGFRVQVSNETNHSVRVTVSRMKRDAPTASLEEKSRTEEYGLEPGKMATWSWLADSRVPLDPVQVRGYAEGQLIFCQDYQPSPTPPSTSTVWSVEVVDGHVACEPLTRTSQ